VKTKKICKDHFVVRQTSGARQRALFAMRFFAPTHGRDPIFAVRFFLAHGKGRHTPFHPGVVSCFFCRAP
jgi:hypothetical protein